MEITVFYSTSRKKLSTTYQLAQRVIERVSDGDPVHEFTLPKDMPHTCVGCYLCFQGHPEKCMGYEYLKPINQALLHSQLIIFAAPVYVFHIPGQLKSLLDHFGYRWMVHQFHGEMMKKQALIITTTAGAGIRSTVKDLRHSMDFWGMARVYTITKALWAAHYTELDEVKQKALLHKADNVAEKIKRDSLRIRPRLKVRIMFEVMRQFQKRGALNPVDVAYWKAQGWFGRKRPWCE